MQSKINGNQPLDWLRDVWFMAGLQNRLPLKQTKKVSVARQGSKYDNTMNERWRQPSTQQKKKDKHIDTFKLFLHR